MKKFAIVLTCIVVGLWIIGTVSAPDTENQRTAATPPQSAAQLAAEREASKQELISDCLNAYGRMCRDETEAFFAGLRSGFNKSFRGE